LYEAGNEHDACGMGFVAHINATRSREVVDDALQMLANLRHRGASGADASTGDGSGILLQIPHAFFKGQCTRLSIRLPDSGKYGVAMMFMPRNWRVRRSCEAIIENEVAAEGWRVLGWRDVPTNSRHAGEQAKRAEPAIRQMFVSRMTLTLDADDGSALERMLYVIRKRIERRMRERGLDAANGFYIASFSTRTVVYKGMLHATRVSRASSPPETCDVARR
jgi:glutamate synthase domain-containing protein 1